VPEALVDRLEAVEVDHDEREASTVPLVPGHLVAEAIVERPPVEEAGQRVEAGQVLERHPVRLELFAHEPGGRGAEDRDGQRHHPRGQAVDARVEQRRHGGGSDREGDEQQRERARLRRRRAEHRHRHAKPVSAGTGVTDDRGDRQRRDHHRSGGIRVQAALAPAAARASAGSLRRSQHRGHS
jgi:hypothetical protein